MSATVSIFDMQIFLIILSLPPSLSLSQISMNVKMALITVTLMPSALTQLVASPALVSLDSEEME